MLGSVSGLVVTIVSMEGMKVDWFIAGFFPITKLNALFNPPVLTTTTPSYQNLARTKQQAVVFTSNVWQTSTLMLGKN
jgi:hypothetical protein